MLYDEENTIGKSQRTLERYTHDESWLREIFAKKSIDKAQCQKQKA